MAEYDITFKLWVNTNEHKQNYLGILQGFNKLQSLHVYSNKQQQ